MSTRETCEAIVDTFTDAQLVNVVAMLQAMRQTIDDFENNMMCNIPNVDTQTAISEVQEMKKDPTKKTYDSFTELLTNLDSEDETRK